MKRGYGRENKNNKDKCQWEIIPLPKGKKANKMNIRDIEECKGRSR